MGWVFRSIYILHISELDCVFILIVVFVTDRGSLLDTHNNSLCAERERRQRDKVKVLDLFNCLRKIRNGLPIHYRAA